MVARRAVFEKDWRDVARKRWRVPRRAGTVPGTKKSADDLLKNGGRLLWEATAVSFRKHPGR